MTNLELVCCLQQFAPCPGDTPAVLLSKQQKLLFVKQVRSSLRVNMTLHNSVMACLPVILCTGV